MPENTNRLTQFWEELKRRKVVRVITVYAAAAFVTLELISIVADPLKLPEWTLTFLIILLGVGFIIAVILSWIYDVGPVGIERTSSSKTAGNEFQESPSRLKAWKIATYISVIIIIVLVILQVFSRNNPSKEILEQEKSIAVLPFENMSDDNEFEHLGDAMTDEIIMQLYKIHEFEVRSRTSIMQYKATDKGSPEIGEELNVNYLLEGSTQRYEDQVRIRVQLIHASTDDHIWGEVFEGAWKEIFNIQVNVAKQVAIELKTVLSPEEVLRIEQEPTVEMEAYNLYLLGRYFWNQIDRDDLDKSKAYYEMALQIDPDFALAYTGLAATFTSYATWGYTPRNQVMFRAKEASIKALEIDHKMAEAHTELAWTKVIHDWDWSGGEEGLIHAIKLNPNSASAHSRYAWLLSMVGRHEEAISECKKALSLDPLSTYIWTSLGRRYYFERDYDRAIEEYRKILENFPDIDYTRAHLALALSEKGSHKEAIQEFLKSSEITSWNWYLGYIYGKAGEMDKAQNILDYYLELSKSEFVWPSNFTFMYAGMGKTEKAIDWLEKTFEQREAWLDLLKVEPMYDNLRSDSRFQFILDQMNFPD